MKLFNITEGWLQVAVLMAFSGLVFLMSWPAMWQPGTYVVGSGGDAWQTMWRFEHKERLLTDALREGQTVPFLKEEFFGGGEARLINLSVWPWMPLHTLFGEPLGYNLVWFLSFVLSGYAMYLLVRALLHTFSETTQHVEMAAFLAGIYYMFLPYHVAQSFGHFGAMQLQWLPFIVLVGWRFWQRPTFWKALGLALLIIVQGWTEHHYMLWLLFFTLFVVLYFRRKILNMFRDSSEPGLVRKKALLAVLLITGVVLTASWWPTISLAMVSGSPLALGKEQLIRFSADIFAFVTPAPFHSLVGPISDRIFASSFTGNVSEATHYLGISALLLTLFFFKTIPFRIRSFWGWTFVLFFMVTLGPRLHIFGEVTKIPLPFELVDSLPGLSSVRAVARASVFVGLSGSILLGFLFASQVRRYVSAFVIGAIILLEFAFLPMPVQSAVPHEAYLRIKEGAGNAILEIPAASNYVAASRALYFETVHGKKTLGNIALERALAPGALATIKQTPGIRQLLYLRTTELREGRPEFFNQNIAEVLPDAMNWIGAEYILVHRDSVSALELASIRRFLEDQVGLSVTEFEDALLYRKPDDVLPNSSDGVFLLKEQGWSNVGYDSRRDAVFAEITTSAEVRLVNIDNSPKRVLISYQLAPESDGEVTIDTGGWRDLGQNRYEASLQPGETKIQFTARNGSPGIIMNPILVTFD